VSHQPASRFNIHEGSEFTHNVEPLLHEIKHALARLLEHGETSVIDLRSIPLAPGEEEIIIDRLGRGEVSAQLQALGPSEFIETRYTGVWLVTHFNDDNAIVSRFIEITRIPDVLKSQHQDIIHAVAALESDLSIDHDNHAETKT
jgi:hydrogenase-1 operon protein HyaF